VFSGESVTLAAEAVLTLAAWEYLVYEATRTNAVMAHEQAPAMFALGQNQPNPFNATTKISFSLAAPSEVRLTIYDVLGREVNTLALGAQGAGVHEITYTATGLASGIYFYRLQAGSRTSRLSCKMVLLR